MMAGGLSGILEEAEGHLREARLALGRAPSDHSSEIGRELEDVVAWIGDLATAVSEALRTEGPTARGELLNTLIVARLRSLEPETQIRPGIRFDTVWLRGRQLMHLKALGDRAELHVYRRLLPEPPPEARCLKVSERPRSEWRVTLTDIWDLALVIPLLERLLDLAPAPYLPAG